jgi:hypothetical protein
MATTKDPNDAKDRQDVEYFEDEIVKDYQRNVDARIRNPLGDLTAAELRSQVTAFCQRYGFTEKEETFQKAALVAQRPEDFEHIAALSDDDKYYMRRETTRIELSYEDQLPQG